MILVTIVSLLSESKEHSDDFVVASSLGNGEEGQHHLAYKVSRKVVPDNHTN